MARELHVKWQNPTALLALVLAAFLFAGCATKGVNKGHYNLLSVKDEQRWGKQIKAQVDADFYARGALCDDPVVNAYVEELGRDLLDYAPALDFDYTFTVVRSPEINAFALPGGHLYVHTGLIEEAENEAQLAAVLAHEISHVVARHGSEKLSAIMTATFVGDVVVSTATTQIDAILTDLALQIATDSSVLAYSRANENEADRIAVELIYRAGYDPRAMQSFFEKMRELHGDSSRAETFFSTHPNPKDRRSRVDEFIQPIPNFEGLILDTPEFQEVKARCLEMKSRGR